MSQRADTEIPYEVCKETWKVSLSICRSHVSLFRISSLPILLKVKGLRVTQFTKIDTNYPQEFHLHLELNLIEEREAKFYAYRITLTGFGGLGFSVLAYGTQVRGLKPGRIRRKGEKILSTPSGGEVKPSVPCRRFAACKRSIELRGNWMLGQICWNISRPRRVSPFSRRWT
jgi:hypothetical protein